MSICFFALHCIHHSRRPGIIWLPVGLSGWLLWSCQADCSTRLYVCRVVRLTAMKLSCWQPYSWANQCCPVHMTHDSTMKTIAPVLCNRSREWFSQQASGPLEINWRPRRDLLKSCQERFKDVGRASKCVRWFILCMSDGNECGPFQCCSRCLEEVWSKMHVRGMILDWWQPGSW